MTIQFRQYEVPLVTLIGTVIVRLRGQMPGWVQETRGEEELRQGREALL